MPQQHSAPLRKGQKVIGASPRRLLYTDVNGNLGEDTTPAYDPDTFEAVFYCDQYDAVYEAGGFQLTDGTNRIKLVVNSAIAGDIELGLPGVTSQLIGTTETVIVTNKRLSTGTVIFCSTTHALFSKGTSTTTGFRLDLTAITTSSIHNLTLPDIAGALPVAFFRQTASTTVANTTTETTLTGSGTGTRTLPASFFNTARGLRLVATGVLSTDATPHTLRIRIKKGSTVLLDTGAQTPTGGLTNRQWRIEVELTARSTTTLIGQTFFEFMTAATGNPDFWEMGTGAATVTIGTTSEAIDITAQWGAGASASDSITLTNLVLETIV